MKRIAVVLGLGAILNAFLFRSLALHIVIAAKGGMLITLLLMWAAAVFTAFKLAPYVEGDDEPSPSLVALLLFTGGIALFVQLLQSMGVGFGFGKLGSFFVRAAQWSVIISALVVLRMLKPRVMLFVGLTAFALQLKAAVIFSPLMIRAPNWIESLITIVAALLIARSFCAGDESPADRVTQRWLLWWFGASGALATLLDAGEIGWGSWQAVLVWLSFLASFVLLVRHLEPDDPDHKPAVPGIGYGPLFLVVVALAVIVSVVFKIDDLVSRWIPLPTLVSHGWLPLLVCVAVSIAIVVFLQLGKRIPQFGPGRKALGWGVALYFAGVLASGSVLAVLAETLVMAIGIALIAAPVLGLAQLLLAVGLLRVLFTLDPRPR